MTSPDMDDEAMKAMAQDIANRLHPVTGHAWSHCYHGALAAIIETRDRDDRLTFTERGDLVLHMVWAIKPGQPQIVAVCTYAELAEKYKAAAGQIVPGATGYVEEIVADHAFGRADIQSAIYQAAIRSGQQFRKDV